MIRKRIETIEEAKHHFYKSNDPVVFMTGNGAKLSSIDHYF